MYLLLLSAVILFFLSVYLFLIFPGHVSTSLRTPFFGRNIAHRGLHTKDKSVPENSLSAFQAAIDHGYGIELDIQLSKDGKLVVFHDDTLERVCGDSRRVDELTYQELAAFPLEGTSERIPLFAEVLSLVDGRVPLVVELKNGTHNAALCTQALLLLRSYSGSYCIESFQPLIVGWFRKHAPDILRGQLSGPCSEFSSVLPLFFRFGLSRVLSNFYARPHFIAYRKGRQPLSVRLCCGFGAMKFIWTVRPEDNFSQLEQENDALIFEYYTPQPVFCPDSSSSTSPR